MGIEKIPWFKKQKVQNMGSEARLPGSSSGFTCTSCVTLGKDLTSLGFSFLFCIEWE